MKFSKKIILLLVLSIFAVSSGCLAEVSYKINTEKETHTGTAYRGEYSLNIRYPVIEGLGDEKVQELINNSIESFIPSEDSLIQQDYEITYSSEKYLSILLKPYQRNDINGAAHGMPGLTGLTYDLKTGQRLTIDDLFKQESNYKEYINKIVKHKIDEINFAFRAEFHGITKDENFYITEENLVVCYPPYLYTCFADGPLKIKIPLKELKPMLKVNLAHEG